MISICYRLLSEPSCYFPFGKTAENSSGIRPLLGPALKNINTYHPLKINLKKSNFLSQHQANSSDISIVKIKIGFLVRWFCKLTHFMDFQVITTSWQFRVLLRSTSLWWTEWWKVTFEVLQEHLYIGWGLKTSEIPDV